MICAAVRAQAMPAEPFSFDELKHATPLDSEPVDQNQADEPALDGAPEPEPGELEPEAEPGAEPEVPRGLMGDWSEEDVRGWVLGVRGLTSDQRAAVTERFEEDEVEGEWLARVKPKALQRTLNDTAAADAVPRLLQARDLQLATEATGTGSLDVAAALISLPARPPPEYVCSLSLDLMSDPVSTSSGQVSAKKAGPSPVCLCVRTKHSRKAGPFSVARLKMDLPFHSRLAYNRVHRRSASPLLVPAPFCPPVHGRSHVNLSMMLHSHVNTVACCL